LFNLFRTIFGIALKRRSEIREIKIE